MSADSVSRGSNSNSPEHVAVIMDGNGRWAEKRGLLRIRGHEVGVRRVEEIIEASANAGIKYLTLYAFSKENWQRPQDEVSFLMNLLAAYLDQKLKEMISNNIIFNTIGDLEDLPEKISEKIKKGMQDSKKNTGLMVTIAFSYSSRQEITRACRLIAEKVREGQLNPENIQEELIAKHLYTAGIPDPDFLIRTSGEMRISNFLLWQISYAELYMTEKFWPDFDSKEFHKALEEYRKRERRFGLTKPAVEPKRVYS